MGVEKKESNKKERKDIVLNTILDTNLKNVNIEPFILILGTIEPRKNIDIVLQFIEKTSYISMELFL